MPIDNAYAGHVVTGDTLGNAVTGIAITDDGTISDIDDVVVIIDDQLQIGTASITIDGDTDPITITSDVSLDIEATTGSLLIDAVAGDLNLFAGGGAGEGVLVLGDDITLTADFDATIQSTAGDLNLFAGGGAGQDVAITGEDIVLTAGLLTTIQSTAGLLTIDSIGGSVIITSGLAGGQDTDILGDDTSLVAGVDTLIQSTAGTILIDSIAGSVTITSGLGVGQDTDIFGDDILLQADFALQLISTAGDITLDVANADSIIIGAATGELIGFYGNNGVVQASALTTALTTATIASVQGTDFAFQALTTTAPFGLADALEAETFVEIVINNQVRLAEIDLVLSNLGLTA